MTLAETTDALKKIDAQIAHLQKERELVQIMDEAKATALDLHSLCCNSYTCKEGRLGASCGWLDENRGGVHDWEGKTHKSYLTKAKAILKKGFTIDDIRELKEVGLSVIVFSD